MVDVSHPGVRTADRKAQSVPTVPWRVFGLRRSAHTIDFTDRQIAALFLVRLFGGDPSKIPSALLGRPAPQTTLPALEGLLRDSAAVPGLDPAAFKGKVSVVNVWASWCVPCHDEAPLLTALAKDTRLQIVGINYKDSPDNARRFLGRYGNPFGIVGVDGNGRGAIEWGVYGVPETFVVGRDGTIVYKLVGPVTPANLDSVLKVEIEKALKTGT
jgi:cytochrome c biogenesis protein CcmG/thiol:disulfide interchange protein DsbE